MPKQQRKHHPRPRPKPRRKPAAASRTAIVRVAAPPEKPWELTDEQTALLKNYLHMGDASELEVKAGLEVARRYRLDPFKQGQIWFIKRWDSSAVNTTGGKGAFVRVPQVGIYGLLHIAARDHADFGSLSDPEYGPMFMHEVEGHKFKAPEWCRVKAFKKGIAEPTVATIYFEEFCPKKWENVQYFWMPSPRNQIAKCAKAQVVRFAWPDLGGLYIPEEMERMNDNYSPSGRQLIQPDAIPQGGSREAAQRVAAQKIAGTYHPSAEPEKPPVQPPKANIPNDPIPVEPIKPREWLGTVEIDWTVESDPIVRGDIGNLLELLQKHCSMVWKEEWWHVKPKDRETIVAMTSQLGYKLIEILPKAVPKGGTAGVQKGAPAKQATQSAGKREANTPAEPTVVSGTIEQIFAPPNTASPMRQVKILTADGKKPTLGCFKHDLFAELDKAKGAIEVYVTKTVKGDKTFLNIVGLKKLGGKEWLADGTPAIQRDREPGKTLFQ